MTKKEENGSCVPLPFFLPFFVSLEAGFHDSNLDIQKRKGEGVRMLLRGCVSVTVVGWF